MQFGREAERPPQGTHGDFLQLLLQPGLLLAQHLLGGAGFGLLLAGALALLLLHILPGVFLLRRHTEQSRRRPGAKKEENNVNGVPFFVRDQRFLDISPHQRGVSPHKPIPPWPSHARPAPGRWLRARCRFPASFNPARDWGSPARPRSRPRPRSLTSAPSPASGSASAARPGPPPPPWLLPCPATANQRAEGP